VNYKISIAFILVSFICLVNAFSQDSHFSNITQTRSFINPSNCGSFKEDYQIAAAYRNQYASVPVGYNTFYLSGEAKYEQLNLGAILLNDKAGDASWQTTQLSFIASKNLKIIDKIFDIAIGVMPSFHFNLFNPEKLYFNNQFLGDSFLSSNPTGENFTINKSFFFSSAFGFNSTYKINSKLILNSGYSFKINSNFLKTYNTIANRISNKNNLQLNLKHVLNDETYINYEINYSQQSKNRQFIFNSILTRKISANKNINALKLGLGIRPADAIMLYTGFVANNFDVNFCYDVNYSGFSKATNSFGAAEIAVVYKLYKSRIIKSNIQTCPVYM